MPATTMVCLANSRKHGGRCIAGVTWEKHDHWDWVRPVSSHGSGELNSERFYEDGSEPQLLDVIDLSLLDPTPINCHAEDILIDPSRLWHKRDNITYKEALTLVPMSPTSLWINGKNTSHGLNDAMNERSTARLRSSLKLICPRKLTITATQENDKRKVRGEFWHGNSHYKLAITDPWIEEEFSQYQVGDERSSLRPLLCISISMMFERTHAYYKLIAGVIEA
jgi:hypothetical protein